MGKKLFREIREGENKEEYLNEMKKRFSIGYDGRRGCGAKFKYFCHLVWNIYHPEDPKTKGDGFHIHHIDKNCLNDDPNNLEKHTLAQHSRIHMIGNKYWLGRHHSDETKRKKSEIGRNRKHSMKTKKKISRSKLNMGIKLSEEHKKIISLANKGKKLSEEHKKIISKVHSGKIISREHREKISMRMRGFNHPKARMVMIEYMIFRTIKKAAEVLNIPTSTIRHRIKILWPGYLYLNKRS